MVKTYWPVILMVAGIIGLASMVFSYQKLIETMNGKLAEVQMKVGELTAKTSILDERIKDKNEAISRLDMQVADTQRRLDDERKNVTSLLKKADASNAEIDNELAEVNAKIRAYKQDPAVVVRMLDAIQRNTNATTTLNGLVNTQNDIATLKRLIDDDEYLNESRMNSLIMHEGAMAGILSQLAHEIFTEYVGSHPDIGNHPDTTGNRFVRAVSSIEFQSRMATGDEVREAIMDSIRERGSPHRPQMLTTQPTTK